MPYASISGLASGLDTAAIISQLMQLEAIGQRRLEARVAEEESAVEAMRSLNASFASLATLAETFGGVETWQSVTATSSSDAVTVTTTPDAAPGQLTVTVGRLATTHQLGFADAHALTDVVVTGSTEVVLDRLDGTTVRIDTGDGTLQGLVTALNDPANATGVRAVTVQMADGTHRLLLESTTTGAATDFTLAQADGTALLGGATVRAGQDAVLDLGAGITTTSTSNTFTDLLPGVTLTLGAATPVGEPVVVTLARDPEALTEQVRSFVDEVNDLLSALDEETGRDPEAGTSGQLAGESGVRAARTRLLETVYPGDGTSMAAYGLELDRYGKLTFDEERFAAAYAADPAAVAAAFGGDTGFAGRVQQVAEGVSDPYAGTLTAAITGRTSTIERLQDSIAEWDVRLELRRTTLTRQFTTLETALNRLTSQSSWLAGQIASLPTGS